MTPDRPQPHLSARAELGELVFGGLTESDEDPLVIAWEYAADEAQGAYEFWCEQPGAESYAVYRACADRADAAQDTLAACS